MHYYEYHHKSPEILQKAKEKYSWLFDMNFSDESRQVRYYLLESLYREYGYKWVLEKDDSGKPLPILYHSIFLYWSISHSENYVAFIVSDRHTGIDIAENDERDISMLDIHLEFEYNLLGGKNWDNFYRLWTAKESIIKANGWWLDDMNNISITEVIDGYISHFAFRQKTYKIHTLQANPMILSYII